MSRDPSRTVAECRRRGTLWILVLGLALMGSSQFAEAQQVSSVAERTDLKITLRMYNYGIADPLLSRAEGEATVILNRAGLEVAWVDCPPTAAERENYPACQGSMGAADFALRILSAKQANRFVSHREALGQALECRRDQVACSAYVFYRDVVKLARDEDASEYQLLGHALAHEVGHLLLGQNSHSATGIMRAKWTPQDLQTIARAHLFFTDEQSSRLRDGVSARSKIQ